MSDPVDKALRWLVYTPVGLAAYLRDTGPSFMEVFVARGRSEVGKARAGIEERLGLSTPEPEPEPGLQQRVVDGLGRVAAQAGTVAAQAGSMVAAMAGPVIDAAARAAADATGGGAGVSAAPGTAPDPTADSGTTAPAAATAAATADVTTPPDGGVGSLPIPGYDQLSASQVVERLDGLSRAALDRVKLYELAHRARRTILAAVDQLTTG